MAVAEHNKKHSITSPSDHNGVTNAVENNFVSFDANGLPKDSGKNNTSYIDLSTAQTITNKRITKRAGSTTSSATPTINTDSYDTYSLTAQAADITSFTTNLSGTPTENQELMISITGTAARAITWGSSFEAGIVALPTTTVGTVRLDARFIWNVVTSKWRCDYASNSFEVANGALSKGTTGFPIDGGGAVIAAGLVQGSIEMPYAGTITKVSLLADVSGSIVVDIWKDTYANYPPTVADTITASAKPTLSSAIKSEDATLTGWTKTFSAGDVYFFKVDSASTVTHVDVILTYDKTGA